MTGSPLPSKLVQNFLSLSGAEVISKLLTLATFAFVARIVGPGGFGYLEFAFSIVMCGTLLVVQIWVQSSECSSVSIKRETILRARAGVGLNGVGGKRQQF